MPSVVATSHGDISSTVERISGARSLLGSAAMKRSTRALTREPSIASSADDSAEGISGNGFSGSSSEISRLRLVAPVPEEDVSGIAKGASVPFQVPAWPERIYSGVIARVSHTLDQKTRTMAVELDVVNKDGSLSPGMFPTLKWPVRRSKPSLFVPKTSVVTTTERTFVIRERSGKAEWVDVKRGASDGDLVEVMGNLQAGDLVVKRATDETRDGTPLQLSAKSK